MEILAGMFCTCAPCAVMMFIPYWAHYAQVRHNAEIEKANERSRFATLLSLIYVAPPLFKRNFGTHEDKKSISQFMERFAQVPEIYRNRTRTHHPIRGMYEGFPVVLLDQSYVDASVSNYRREVICTQLLRPVEGFSLRQHSLIDRIRFLSGRKSIVLGDSEFDARFLLDGDGGDKALATVVLDLETRAMLLNSPASEWIITKDNVIAKSLEPLTTEALWLMLDHSTALARRIQSCL